MKEIITKTEDGKILIKLKKEFYEKAAIFSAAHKLTDKFTVFIEPFDNFTVGVYIQPKTGIMMEENEIKKAIFDFSNDVIDEQLRIDLETRYGSIRELIVKQAFSPLPTSELKKKLEK